MASHFSTKILEGDYRSNPISKFEEESIKLYASARKQGLTVEESKAIYDKWAETYDEECPVVGYKGWEHAANAVAQFYDESARETIRILDVAAGTGLVGKVLAEVGFRNLDALEPSDGMLKHLRALNVYQNVFQDTIGTPATINPLPSDAYDCLTLVGGLGNGHIPKEGLEECIRIVKPGGTVFICILDEHLTSKHLGGEEIEPYMEELEKKSYWTKIHRTVVENYTWNEPGVVFGYKVLINGTS